MFIMKLRGDRETAATIYSGILYVRVPGHYPNTYYNSTAGFEIFTAVFVMSSVFLDITP
jgi:hypothetical protein